METAELDMIPRIARTEAERYARCTNLTKKDKAILKAYRSIAHGARIIDINKTIALAGLGDDGFPKLAICRADATKCNLYNRRPFMEFNADVGQYDKQDTKVRNIMTTTNWGYVAWATVPYVPPYIRKADMARYHILWEATWNAAPKGDPMLLSKVGDNLFRVIAAWDLTPVEAAVLNA